uniref:Uncharacterized protein n=1 Tax=Amphimedon queenslandica TaxID=400682 RepID=A0A1X7T7W6_AMPQE
MAIYCKIVEIGKTGTRMPKLKNLLPMLKKVIVITQTIRIKPLDSAIKGIHNQKKKPLKNIIKGIDTAKIANERNAINKIWTHKDKIFETLL